MPLVSRLFASASFLLPSFFPFAVPLAVLSALHLEVPEWINNAVDFEEVEVAIVSDKAFNIHRRLAEAITPTAALPMTLYRPW